MKKLVPFTYQYSQPEDYHFCQDSVIAPQLIAEDLAKSRKPPERLLDVCAGCGVFALELQYHLPEISRIHFLEIQSVFEPHLHKNVELVNARRKENNQKQIEGALHAFSFARLVEPQFEAHYDLIIANPPYFVPDEASLAENEIKRRARFFIDGSLAELIQGIQNALKPEGSAYLLVKSGEKHGSDRLQEIKTVAWNRPVETIADVRGTDLVRIGPVHLVS
jgi:tRNA1Val (adenine37-N6)-methyltransferase